MVKATFELQDGTVVKIDGDPAEVQKLMEFYTGKPKGDAKKPKSKAINKATSQVDNDKIKPNLVEIINIIKSCDEAEAIEKNILDRPGAVNRVLLPLYIVYKYLDNKYGLTTTEIQQITTELGVRIYRQNANRTMTGSGSGYVMADRHRKPGSTVRYTINRRGIQYLESVIHESKDV